MQRSLITLTIGQSPRNDMISLLRNYLPENQLGHVGILDGMTLAEIEQHFAPKPQENVLITRLNEGCQVRLSAKKVEKAIQKTLLMLEKKGCEIVLLLCNNKFHLYTGKKMILLEPGRIIPPLIASIVKGHQVGIVVPVMEQISAQTVKWCNLVKPPCFAVVSPYQNNSDLLTDVALLLMERGVDVVVMDCFSYQPYQRYFLQKLMGIPVLMPGILMAKLAAELLA